MIYDCIIAGSGPSGSLCAYIMQKIGLKCLIMEKLNEHKEKVCGGFLPPYILIELKKIHIDLFPLLAQHAVPIRSWHTEREGIPNVTYFNSPYIGIGTERKYLDDFFTEKALEEGADILYNTKVHSFSYENNLCTVNGKKCRKLIMACGARGMEGALPLSSYKGQTFAISSHITGETSLLEDRVYFWYLDSDTKDYFWAIPIGKKRWNVGLWYQIPRKGMLYEFNTLLARHILPVFSSYSVALSPRGAFLGSTDLSRQLDIPCYGIGDFGGFNDSDSGEGLYQCLTSAANAALQTGRDFHVFRKF